EMLSPGLDQPDRAHVDADEPPVRDVGLNEVDFDIDIDAPQPPPPPPAALLDESDLDKCSRADLLAMLRDLLADRVRLLRRHSSTVDQLSARLSWRSDELHSIRQSAESVGRENADLRRLLAGVESERLRLLDTGQQWRALAGQSGAALANELADLRVKVAGLERLLGQLDGGDYRRLPADGQEAAASINSAVANSTSVRLGADASIDVGRRLASVESSLPSMRPSEALMLRHLVTLARQKQSAAH
ncbi:hypothetical protein BOX15_Mlig011352g1, partial [Macrostomum lignano]